VQPQINLARKSTGLLEKYRPNAPITQISKAITQPEFRPQFKTALNKSFEQYNINVGTPEQQKEKFRSMAFGFTGAEFGKVIPLASKLTKIKDVAKIKGLVKGVSDDVAERIAKSTKIQEIAGLLKTKPSITPPLSNEAKLLAQEAGGLKVTDELIQVMRKNDILWHDIEKSFGRKLDQGNELDLRLALNKVKQIDNYVPQGIKYPLTPKNATGGVVVPSKGIEGAIETKLLGTGRQIATNVREARSLFKKGRFEDVRIKLKPNEKPFIFSEKGGQSKSVNIRVLGSEKTVPIKINALNDVSPETVKDISGLDASFRSVYKNFEKAFGNRIADVKRRILDPFDASKGNMIREQEVLASDLKKTIVDGLGIKKGSKESALVQQYGEGRVTRDQLEVLAGKKTQDIINADSWFRSQYDRLLGEVNAVRAQIYPNNPAKQIPRRSDYYRHFQELTGMEGLRNLFDSPANIPTELAGVSDVTSPKSKFLSFAQKRLGFKTKDDAVGGFINYLRSATYAKNIDPHIAKFRGLADELTNLAQKSEQPALGSRFAEYLRDYANDLSGKTNPLDRSLQKIVGRKVFSGITWLNSRVKANVILGNLSSAVAQAGNTPQMMAKSGYRNWAGGFMDTINSSNKIINKSDFIKERYSHSLFDQFDTKILDQPKKAVVWITKALDELATKIGWNGFYRQAVQKGLPNPVKYADDITREMVGGRGVGEVPTIQKSKAVQLIAPFQLEVQNLIQVLGKEVKNKEIGVILKYALAAYGFNRAAKAIRGSGVTFDPIQAVVDATKAYQEEDNRGIGAMRAGGRLGGEVLSNVMFGQQIASLYPEYGVKIGGENITRKELFGKKDPTRFGSGLIAGAAQNPLYKILPPFGGAQLEKTIKGTQAYSKGYVENKGKQIQYQIDKTPVNLVKSLAFGKYATSNAREYFDKQRTALSEKQTGLVKVGAKSYSDIMTEREQNKALDKLKAGKKTTGTEDLGDGLYRVGEKFYSKILDKEFTTRDKADEAIKGEEFLKSGKAVQIIGDKVFRANDTEKGYGVTTKIKYDTDLTTEKLQNAKTAKNMDEWMKLAEVQAKNYETQLQDPTLDELEKIQLQQKYDKLMTDASKYAGYGGFTKGRKGKKAKVAKILKVSASTRISVPKAPSFKVSIPKIAPIRARQARNIEAPSGNARVARAPSFRSFRVSIPRSKIQKFKVRIPRGT